MIRIKKVKCLITKSENSTTAGPLLSTRRAVPIAIGKEVRPHPIIFLYSLLSGKTGTLPASTLS